MTALFNLNSNKNFTTAMNNSIGINTGITQIQSTLKVNGSADFDDDVRIKGRSVTQAINSIDKLNERLNILVPNPKLEAEWSELADLRQRYVELERELLEKQRVFDILKKCD